MNITYIGHSGFYLELEHCAMLFDYAKGPLPDFDFSKPLYIFISHHHADHFSPMLFPLFRGHPSVRFLLSADVERHFGRQTMRCLGVTDGEYQDLRFLAPGERYADERIEVTALATTEEGIAFLLRAEGKRIFHAGDLNLWVWPGRAEEENSRAEEAYNRAIAPLAGMELDVAFLPLDPRQEELYWKGFDRFMRRTRTALACPMHFWDRQETVEEFLRLDCTQPYRDRVSLARRSDPHVKLFPHFEY